MPALEGGAALPITTGGTGQTEARAAVPVYVVPGGPVIGQRARRVVVVTSGPVEGGAARPVYDAGAGALYSNDAALPVFVVSGSLGGGSVAFTPASIAGLQAWFKADALALANNDPVASWTDSSGLAHHAVQASGTLQPLYQTNQVNSLPAVLFDGTDDFLQTGVFTLSHPCTVFVVVKQITWAGSDRIHEGRSAGNTLLLRQNSATPSIQMVGTLSGTTVVGPAIGAWGLVSELWNAAASAIAINGGADAAFDLGVAKTPNGLSLGSSHAGISNGNVSIAEFLVYDTALSAPNIALVKAYLNTKYALF